MQTTARIARHYPEGVEIDSYPGATIDVQRDGDESVLLDATNVPESRSSEHPWGRPGIGLELSVEQARDLGSALLRESGGITVAVLVVRHPDASNTFTVSAPAGVDVLVLDADYGSSFDGEPEDAEEAESAISIADTLTAEASGLPDGDPVKDAVAGIAEELLEEAAKYVDIDEVRAEMAAIDADARARLAAAGLD